MRQLKQKNSKKLTWSKNPLYLSLICFSCLFLMIAINALVFMQQESYDIISNPYNSARSSALSRFNERGTIYSNDLDKLAYSVINNDVEKRIYPYGRMFAHVVGFDDNGKLGIESMADMQLLDSDIPLTEKIQNNMNHTKNPGDDVFTTLDVKIQQTAYEALGDRKGAIIVLNPKTGEVISMVSKPDFDPTTVTDNWSTVIADEETSCLLNRATQGLYPPGSIFKIVDTLEYLGEHGMDTSNFSYECHGVEEFNDNEISCFHSKVHGKVGFKEAFAQSCNCAYANMGNSFNEKRFEGTLSALMFNSNLPTSFPHSKSIIDMNVLKEQSELLQVSIGQGVVQMSPLHVAMITSAIANDGVLMKPYVISSIKTPSGGTVKEYGSSIYGSIMTSEETNVLKELMEAVVTDGTGDALLNSEYTCAGKTGSAEFSEDSTLSHAWFTGYAPADNPELVVTVIVENGGSGGSIAAPIAKQIWDSYFNEE